ncbi:hypothetical protein T4B_15360 [Trichinella pseudospiralis]|uniref:Uncharacterized protein n=1 Tax=Trichinella pseudospiralis TaxID=6337 RepID=A0A0V1GFN9_TRIPS|nr:hypothetical protein T4B_2621 [Trichinella pseudospiralis]KRY97033.1 hypothetical protein T4B_15360 [Trichinella pseudospiralis]
MAFYMGLSEKSKVLAVDSKNRKEIIFVLKYTDKNKRSSFNGILQGFE